MKRTTFGIGLVLATILLSVSKADAQLTPTEVVAIMHPGINLGNTLEAPREGEWAPKAEEYFFDDFKDAGFKTVRIPVRWDNHMGTTAPYTIDSAFMARVEQVVDWSLNRGFITILNSHHDDWIKTDYTEANIARFDSLWAQVSRHFSCKTDSLLFEIINEPNGLTISQVDEINARELATIRLANPTRIVIFSGNKWSGTEELLAAKIPTDNYVMGYFHSYDPSSFALDGKGTFSSTATVTGKFEKVVNWRTTNNIQATIDEFGAVRSCDYNSRMLHYATYVSDAIQHNIPAVVWDDAGNFQIYDRRKRTWDYEVRDIVTKYSNTAPCQIKISAYQDSLLAVSWKILTVDSIIDDSIVLMRRTESAEYQSVGKWLPADAERQIVDYNTVVGQTYYYRLLSYKNGVIRQISYPQRHTKLPYNRHTFGKMPTLPCTIEAEDFDYGGEQLTYHDADDENSFGQYRPDEAVDIFRRADGEYLVAANAKDEWIEFTINVETEGRFVAKILTTAEQEGGHLHVKYAGGITKSITIPKSADINISDTTTFLPTLPAGEQTLRFVVSSLPVFNIDKIIFENIATDVVESKFECSIGPNPVTNKLTIDLPKGEFNVVIMNVVGEVLTTNNCAGGLQNINMQNFQNGVYVVKIISADNKFRRTVKVVKEQ